MNRNTEAHFAETPHIHSPRSVFPVEFNHKTTFNVGQLIPLAITPILAGDTFQLDQHAVIRTTTTVVPVMDNLYMDFYAFYAPNRILWTHFKEFLGENTSGAWTQTTEYSIPQLTTPTGGANSGTLMDYMGVPIGVAGLSYSAMPNRLYTKIVNEFFRDQNVTAPLTEYTDDTDRTASNTTTELGGAPFIVSKFHDYMTSALPAPQKSDPVTIPVGTNAPVKGTGIALGLTNGTTEAGLSMYSGNELRIFQEDLGKTVGTVNGTTNPSWTNASAIGVSTDATKSGLYTDLSNAVAATINAQRYAFALQRIYERNAVGGTRYREVLKSIYNVSTMNKEVQIPEYLGGKRVPLSLAEIAQTSETGTTPLGSSAGLSVTGDSDRLFTKSFVEPGWLMVLGCVRYRHTYSQGLNRNLSKKLRFDFWYPQFNFLGEQPIYNKELYAQGPSAVNANTGKAYDEEVFGYQERWAELRYWPSMVTGEFRPQVNTLGYWNYADYYASLPTLSTEFIQEDLSNVDRTLAVTSELANQIRIDYLLKGKAWRNLPIVSVPGLLDHY